MTAKNISDTCKAIRYKQGERDRMRPMPELEVVKVPTEDLLEYQNNAKIHDHQQVDQIAASIEEFGFNNPILAWHNDDGEPEIVAGHGRPMAARKLGLEELPVVFLDHMTEEQRRAYILVDNQLTMNSGFDEETLESELSKIFDIDMEQFDFDVTVQENEEADLEPIVADEDELPEISPTRAKAGQIWALGDHRLACGYSTEPRVVEALMCEEKADLLLTDPPYNVVLDLFCGSGSTIIACEQMGRKCRAVELDPHYADVTIERWERFTGKNAELVGMVE